MPLHTELVLFMHRDSLERVPFFQGKDLLFIADVVSHLRLQYFSPVRAPWWALVHVVFEIQWCKAGKCKNDTCPAGDHLLNAATANKWLDSL